MTLSIYCKNQREHFSLSMFFDLNGQDYKIIDSKDDKIIISDGVNKVNVELDIFHNVENQDQAYIDNSKTYITNTISNYRNRNVIFNDFLFNRTKAYYSQFPFRPYTKKWYNHGQLSYIIPTHPAADIKNKIYVAPNKTYNNTKKYRSLLVKTLKNNYLNFGYLGNYDDNPDLFLYSQIEFTWIDRLIDLETQTSKMHYNWWGYCPPHNEYYKNTFISIYGETIEYGNTIVTTEKTFDPLIKGHFILPFSTSGFIQHLKSHYNFKFPEFIDYTYDTIKDDDQRYAVYELEVKRLLEIDIHTWKQHWNDNFEKVIRNNQMIFQEKPYDRIDFYKVLTGHNLNK